uniref:TFIID_20kDa domain-containing protein n=1 Tax=Steinernema glaseri TaxID=37863 RepID=A0A1I8AIQ6_9BILA
MKDILKKLNMEYDDFELEALKAIENFAAHYTKQLLTEAQKIAEHSDRTVVSEGDVRFAIHQSLSREREKKANAERTMAALAEEKNSKPLPVPKSSDGKLTMPTVQSSQLQPNFRYKASHKPDVVTLDDDYEEYDEEVNVED